MRKHHEYWLELGSECDDIVWRKKPTDCHTIHVIDYKAYKKLQTEYDILKAEFERIMEVTKRGK